ncbi:glycosyltransferase family 2 protein [Desulforamulus ferrireducens]|nr:hypothetical protein [Desulforamulus ferrireducens]
MNKVILYQDNLRLVLGKGVFGLKILIGSPVRQKPLILKEFLLSLEELDKGNLHVDYFFIDDNVIEESSELLNSFARENSKSLVTIIQDLKTNDEYLCNEETHHWNEKLVWKVADFKNIIIEHALKNNYDYLFLIDSDIVLHPKTLQKLLEAQKDIISNIFWTRFDGNLQLELPQVWLRDAFDQIPRERGEELTEEEKSLRWGQFLQQLRQPGIYEVGGLGACTLISHRALAKGVNFSPISNISFWGEDRHFCIRAAVLGLSLYVDTHYPAYHIYRESDLAGLADYKNKNKEPANLVQLVKKAVEELGSFHYQQPQSANWQSFCTARLQGQLLAIVKRKQQKLAEQKQIIKVTVTDCVEEEDNNQKRVSFTMIKNSLRDGLRTFEQLESFVIVLPDEKNNWLIDQLVVEDILE